MSGYSNSSYSIGGNEEEREYCRHCDLYKPCLCDEKDDPTVDASTSNPGVVIPKGERNVER